MLCIAQRSWYKRLHSLHSCKPPNPCYRWVIGAGSVLLNSKHQREIPGSSRSLLGHSILLLLTCFSPTLTLLKLYWKIRKVELNYPFLDNNHHKKPSPCGMPLQWKNASGPPKRLALTANAESLAFWRVTEICLLTFFFLYWSHFFAYGHLENGLSLTPSWHEPRTAAPAIPAGTRSQRRAAATLSTHTCSLSVLVLHMNQYFLLLIDRFLHQKFKSHLATVPRKPWVAGGNPGRTASASQQGRRKQIHRSVWASTFHKLVSLWTRCLCSQGAFPCVPMRVNLSVGFFQINFETNTNQITY